MQTLFGTHAAVARSISTRSDTAGTVSAIADPDAAISLAWQHIVDNIHVALLMALAIAFFASLAIAHTLAPAQLIVTALQRMAHGQYRTPLPRFRSMELAMIGQAVGDLGERLAQATEERAVLTRRLLEIRNDERRALARELHDEFGQNLSAILAFASIIEATGAQEQAESKAKNDVAQDARMISQATLRIMACLRDTLTRLRHPPAEELGLEACLVSLVDSWRSQNATQPMIQLDLQGDLADVRGIVAATAYRVAQECLTNSLRHSAAREIVLRIERRTGTENALLIRVEDDGGGDAAKVAQSAGFGLTGIRERVAALGGSLSIARARVASAWPPRFRSPRDVRMTASQTKGISILLVDDHPVVRQGYRRVLEHQSDFRVVAEADNAVTLTARSRRMPPTSWSWTYRCPAPAASRPSGTSG